MSSQYALAALENAKILALYSSQSQVGKTTLAKYLEGNYGFFKISFAGAVREKLRLMMESNPYINDPEELFENLERDKTQILPGTRMSYRDALIHLGMSMRGISPDYWLWSFIEQINFHTSLFSTPIIVDDLRFQNEYDMLKDVGAYKIKLISTKRRGISYAQDGQLEHCKFDLILDTDNPKKYAILKELFTSRGFYEN